MLTVGGSWLMLVIVSCHCRSLLWWLLLAGGYYWSRWLLDCGC